jgi:hypothetical protein
MSEVSNFTPPAKALEVVGIDQSVFASDDSIYAFISQTGERIRHSEAQIAVAIYTLHMRGADDVALVSKTGLGRSTVYRYVAEGMAILRTGNIDRAVAAVRTAGLSVNKVDELTKGKSKTESKLSALETGALGSFITSNYVTEDKGTAPDVSGVSSLLPYLKESAEGDAVPAVLSEMVKYLPLMAEEMGIKRKTRTPRDSENGPFGLEYHFTAALKDLKAIEQAADDEKYLPTEQDMAALLALMSYIGVDLAAQLMLAQQ